MASNVALRRQVFESKASADSSWRWSIEEKFRDLKDVNALSSETSSMSAEPPTTAPRESSAEKAVTPAAKKERPKPVRENSYLTAVRASPETAVVLRQKTQLMQRVPSEEDNRKTRRTSYLKATANEEFQPLTSDTDQNSAPTTQDEDDPQQLKR